MAPSLYAPFESAVLALLVSAFVAVAFYVAPDAEGDTFDLVIFALPAGTLSTFGFWWWLGAARKVVGFWAYVLGGMLCVTGAAVLNLLALTLYSLVTTGGFTYSLEDLGFFVGLLLLNGVGMVAFPGAIAALVFAFLVRPRLRRRYGPDSEPC